MLEQPILIAGVDEAGRGPLAGPVFAGAVILHSMQSAIIGLTDSKQLSAQQREKLFWVITQQALTWSVAQASATEIDQYNILEATLLAMHRALMKLYPRPQQILIDGNYCPKYLDCPARAVIKGDQKIPAISAASIIAKVLRDRHMQMLDKQYPLYGFAQHKGYPTKQHIAALQQYGPSNIHRYSFRPVAIAVR